MALFWRSLYNGSLSPDPDSIALFLNRYDLGSIALSDQYFYAYLTVSRRDGSVDADPRSYPSAADSSPLSAVDDGKGGLSFPALVRFLKIEMGPDTWLAVTDTKRFARRLPKC